MAYISSQRTLFLIWQIEDIFNVVIHYYHEGNYHLCPGPNVSMSFYFMGSTEIILVDDLERKQRIARSVSSGPIRMSLGLNNASKSSDISMMCTIWDINCL